jgi:hypothetical protein
LKKYHIILDDIGFIVQDETYHKKLQPPFPPRFSMEKGNYNDLSFFTFYKMNDWQGGEGVEKVLNLTPNAFKESIGLNTLDPGEIKLSSKVELFADLSKNQDELKIIEYGDKIILYGAEGLGLSPKPFTSAIITVQNENVLVEKAKKERLFNLNKIWTSGMAGDDTHYEWEECGYINARVIRGNTWQTLKAKRGLTLSPWGYYGSSSALSTNYEYVWPKFFPWYQYEFYTSSTQDDGSVLGTQSKTDEYLNGYLFFDDSSGEIIKYHKLTLKQEFKITGQVLGPSIFGNQYVMLKLHKKYQYTLQGIQRGMLGTTVSGHLKYTKVYKYIPARYEERTVNSEFVPRTFSSTLHNNRLVLGCEGIIRSLLLEDGKLVQKEYRKTTITDDDNDLVRTVDAVCSWDANTVIAAIDGNNLYRVGLNATGTGEFVSLGTVAGIDKIVKIIVYEQMIWYAGYGNNYHSWIGTTDGTSIIQPTSIPPMQISDMVSFQGLLCYCGKTSEGKGVLYGYPDTLMLEMEEAGEDCGIRELNASSGYLFIPQSYGPKIQALTSGKEGQTGGIACFASLDKNFDQGGMITDLEWFQDSIYFITKDNMVWKSNPDRYIDEGYLITSKFYGEAELQNKIWFSVIIELKENLPLSCGIELYAQRDEDEEWVALGVFSAEEISHEFFFPTDFNSKAVQLKFVMKTENARETAIITGLTIRHVLTSLNKFVWAMAIRADSNLKLLDKSCDTRTGADIRDDLLEICKDQKVITLTDLDESEHKVIITDMDITVPLIKDDNQEALISLELLEA